MVRHGIYGWMMGVVCISIPLSLTLKSAWSVGSLPWTHTNLGVRGRQRGGGTGGILVVGIGK